MANGNGWPSHGSGMFASLNPNQLPPQVAWHQVAVAEPAPWIPYGDGVGYMTRDYVVEINNETANVAVQTKISFDQHVALVTWVAATRSTNGTAFAVGSQPNDHVAVLLETASSGDKLQTTTGILSAFAGPHGGWPRKIAFGAWQFQAGTSLLITLTPLLSNLRVTCTFQAVEIRAGQNFGPIGR